MSENLVTLRVNGREWGGWTSVRISAGIERIARDFNVQITRQWPGDTDQRNIKSRIQRGDVVEVLIGDDLVITGYVEATPVRYDANSKVLGISGRSKTCDLIDCSAEPKQYESRSVSQVAADLAEPFGISVIDATDNGTLQSVQADQGETVIDVLNKMLGLAPTLVYDNAQGQLVIGDIGIAQATTALVLGENILSCDTEQSIRERFSVYSVSGQRKSDDDDFGEATTSAIRAETVDNGIARYRPLIIRQTGNATTGSCGDRSDFEMERRAARTDETTYTVQGWRQGNGALWQPNMTVVVWDPELGFDNREMVIAEVNYQQNENGTITELRVGPSEAYLHKPAKKTKRKKKKEEDF
ncbi:baseplate protein [Lonsdalea britannica]|uniref:phage baseplate assembly protein n=1 Tax=Lonsdalea britannica TaxID=1082704 RepID=UPI000A1ED0E3|nr:baseplate protein [Lonsdalea britannica]OSN04203.1 baseplate protein [Lonsdalea britannica]